MNKEESIQQIETLIEAWQLDEADLNQTDINAMQALLKENQELKKKYENAVADYETTMFEKEQLKKQLEESKDNYNCLLKQKEQFEYIMSKQVDYQGQQKEFINYLEDEIDICDGFLDTVKSDLKDTLYGVMSSNKTYITNRIKENETAQKVYKEILQKYKSIIGGKHE